MKTLKVAFDTTKMHTTTTGVHTFSKNMLAFLQQQPDVEIIELCQKLKTYPPTRRGKLTSHLDQLLWLHTQLPYQAARAKADVLLCPEVAIPYYHRTPTVAVVHDMLMRLYPAAVGMGGRIFHRLVAEETVRFADRIICGSEATKRDLLRLIPVLPERISVIYYAAASLYRPLPADAALRETLAKYGLPNQKYIIMVGARNKRKNHVTLVKAFSLLKQQPDFSEYQLALVGPPAVSLKGDSTAELKAIIKQDNLVAQVKLIENPSDAEVVQLYNGAAIFAYPSEAEGFGLPLLEAMQCGVPVITSKASAMPEVTGEAALYYDDPLDASALAKQLAVALSKPELLHQMRAKGLERARLFSWEKTGQQTLAVLRAATHN